MTAAGAAPAKINLYLRVTGRRSDGYHEIDTLFLPLALADEVKLAIEAGPAIDVSCRCPGHPHLDGPSNLAARAATRFLETTGHTARVSITIHKRIWVGAGLGGGSSDAAVALLLLQQATGADVNLSALALELGADVPFFLDPRPSRATGIGQRLTPVRKLPSLQLVLVNPGVPLPTTEVFDRLGPPPSPGWTPPTITPACLTKLVHNDLELTARKLCPAIEEMSRVLLTCGAEIAGLSGSGPTVFGIFGTREQALVAAEQVHDTVGFSTLVSHTHQV